METKNTGVPAAPLKKSAKGGSPSDRHGRAGASGGKTKKNVVVAKAMPIPVVPSHGVCKTCSLLPVGSVELTSLLLVLVFSLVSVLFTAVFALNSQQQKISDLQELVSNS